LAIIALCIAAVAACSVLWQAWHAAPIDLHDHCGFDGWSWCQMATWHPGFQPYQRRFLGAFLIFLTHPTPSDAWVRFLVLDVLSTIALFIGMAVLTRRLAIHLGASSTRARWAGVIAASSLALPFYPWHYSLMVPSNSDVFSAALGLGWILLVTSTDERWAWTSVPLAFLTQAARDTWAPAVLLCCLVLFLLVRRRRWMALANAVAVGVAIGISLRVHAVPGSTTQPLLQVYRSQLVDNFGSVHGFAIYLYLVAFGLGALSLFALPTLHRALRDPQLALPWTLAIVSAMVATVAGGTTDRYLFPALMMLLCLGMGWIAARRSLVVELALILALAVSIGLWRPWETLSGNVAGILRIYDPYTEPWSVNRPLFVHHLVVVGLAASIGIVAAGAMAVAYRRLSPREA
jgi:hypothetical protein